ncbi:MAG: CDP-glycerol glycerophosphotransferase family protein [Eubacterium sp.]|nr:CDP-glycerol glycerophosphotransferase family protein [Candidatus Colimonas fimequi]
MSLTNKLKATLITYLKKHPEQRQVARNMMNKLRGNRYLKKYGKYPLDEKKVLFEVFNGRQYSCNPRAIYEEMLRSGEFEGWTFVWSFEDTEKHRSIPKLEGAKFVTFRSDEYYYELATSKYVITNAMLFDGISRKDGQVVMQTWHGTPLKRLRCDIQIEDGNVNNSLEEIRIRNDKDVVRYTHFLSPSAWASDRFISSFNLDGMGMSDIITEVGYPRNDILSNYTQEDIDEIYKIVGAPKDKKVILYAPTFRDNNHVSGQGYTYDLKLDFDRLREELGDEYIILFRTHYFIANSFDFAAYEGFIYDVSRIADISELYLMTDILITDYSSVFFDYACLKRPIVFYMYDLEEYGNSIRGFYLDLEKLPGEIVKTEDQLIDAINTIREKGFNYDNTYKEFNEMFNYLDDGKAARRVIDVIFDKTLDK